MMESGFVGRYFCPECEPQADQIPEILTVDYCGHHRPPTAGVEDAKAQTDRVLTSGGEADSHECALMADLLRRVQCARRCG